MREIDYGYEYPIKARRYNEWDIDVRLMRKDEMPDDGETYYCDVDGTIYMEGEPDFKLIKSQSSGMQLKNTEDYVDEFTEYFGDLLSDFTCCSGTTCNCGGTSALPSAKKWLRTTLEQDRQDTITAVIEMVEGMEKSVNQLDLEVNDITELQKSGYNQALTDIITKLQALSPEE